MKISSKLASLEGNSSSSLGDKGPLSAPPRHNAQWQHSRPCSQQVHLTYPQGGRRKGPLSAEDSKAHGARKPRTNSLTQKCANFRDLPKLSLSYQEYPKYPFKKKEKKNTWISWMACPIAPEYWQLSQLFTGLGFFYFGKKCLQVCSAQGTDGLSLQPATFSVVIGREISFQYSIPYESEKQYSCSLPRVAFRKVSTYLHSYSLSLSPAKTGTHIPGMT